MDPASLVAFIGFGVQVVDVIKRLLDLIAQVKDAPNSVQRLRTELEILESIVGAAVRDDGEKFKHATVESCTAYQKALDAVNQLCGALLALLKNTLPRGSASRRKRLLGSLNFAFQEEKLAGLVMELERAKSSLLLAQMGIASESSARSTSKLQETNARMLKLMQAIVRTGERSDVEGVYEQRIDAWKCFSLESIGTVRDILQDQEQIGEAIESATPEQTQSAMNDGQVLASTESTSDTVQAATIQQAHESTIAIESHEMKDQTWHTFRPATHGHDNSGAKLSDMQDQYRKDQFGNSLSEAGCIQHDSTSILNVTSQRLPVLHSSPGPMYNRKHDSLSALKSRTDITMFHNPLLGTVLVSRRASVAKEWNAELRRYEKRYDSFNTIVRVRPAPWLLQRGYEIRVEELMTRYGDSTLNISLDALRYSPLTSADRQILRNGDLGKLQRRLEERTMSIKDRDPQSGMNLLESTMEALMADWINWETDPNPTGSKSRLIVKTARWLVSQGLTFDFGPDRNKRLIEDRVYTSAPEDKQDLPNQVYELECLLLESTENAPCLERVKTLLFFAICNPERSRQLRCTILELINEAAVDHGPEYFAEAERQYWAKEEPIDFGMESVIACSMLQLAKPLQENSLSMRRQILKGPRRLLYKCLSLLPKTTLAVLQDSDPSETDQAIAIIANILDLCKSLAILDDGFGDHLMNIACKDHYLNDLLKILERASCDPGTFMARHQRQGQSLKHPLYLTVSGNDKPSSQSLMIVARDPHMDWAGETDEALRTLQDAQIGFTYSSHEDENHDLCFAHQEGTELHFSCYESNLCKCIAQQPQADANFWATLDRATEYYTSLEKAEKQEEVETPASGGMLRRLVSVGLEIMSSVV